MNMNRWLAQSDPGSAINQWLDQNPIVLGLIIASIGAVLVVIGIRELRSGVAVDKRGRQFTGGMAQFIAVVRVVGGLLACLFGLYKIVFG